MLQRIIILIFCLSCFQANSQDLDWVKGIYADTAAIVYKIEFTPENDIIASILTRGTSNLPDSSDINPYPYYFNYHLVKFSVTGDIIWDVRVKSDFGASFGNFILDSAGNIYVTGMFTKEITFGNSSYYTDTSASFIAKLNSNAKAVWLRKTLGLALHDIQIASSDKIIALGYTKTKFSEIENGTSISHFQNEYFRNYNFTAFNTNGELLWSKFYGGDSLTYLGSFGSWKLTENAIYHLSEWGGNLDVQTGAEKTIISGREYFIDENWFLSKYNAEGEFLWVKILQKDISNHSGKITRMHFDVDENENLIIAGAFYGKIDLDFSDKEYLMQNKSYDYLFKQNYFIAKYDSSFALKWAYASKNALQNSHFLYFDRLRIKIKKESFYLYGVNWVSLDVDFSGNLLPNNNMNQFFAEYNMEGKLLTARFFGRKNVEDRHTPIYNLNVDEYKNVYLCGVNYFSERFDYDPSPDSIFINDTLGAHKSGFIARYQTCKKPIQIIPQFQTTDCHERMTTLYAQNDHYPVRWYDESGQFLHEGIT